MEPDQTAVEVTVDDLAIIQAALNAAYHQNTVLDLADQYRKLSQRSTPSKLAAALLNAMTLASAYIELALHPEPEDEPDA